MKKQVQPKKSQFMTRINPFTGKKYSQTHSAKQHPAAKKLIRILDEHHPLTEAGEYPLTEDAIQTLRTCFSKDQDFADMLVCYLMGVLSAERNALHESLVPAILETLVGIPGVNPFPVANALAAANEFLKANPPQISISATLSYMDPFALDDSGPLRNVLIEVKKHLNDSSSDKHGWAKEWCTAMRLDNTTLSDWINKQLAPPE